MSEKGRDAADCGLAREARHGQYAQRFAENDISFSVLPDLTDQDLKELGVSLGHRRKMLRGHQDLPSASRGNICADCRELTEACRTPPSAVKSR